MFSDELVRAVVNAAKINRIEPAALLAIVECECDGGRPFESDGRTPCLLYERHVAWEESEKVGRREAFVADGLAHKGWQKSTQYKDQGTSAKRLALIKRACAINDEAALRSASWGVGQTMGFLAEELGFNSAREMVDFQTGSVDGQIDCMVREIKGKHLVDALNAHNWARVAKVYNGPAYAQNQYDTRMASAYARWVRRLDTTNNGNRDTPPEQLLTPDQVRDVQTRLDELGYHEVGTVDGSWGSRTTGALAAFQAHEGLSVSGHYDDATRKALIGARAREVSETRSEATAQDLIAAGSRTVSNANQVDALGKIITTLGAGGAAGTVADAVGALDKAKEQITQLQTITNTLGEIQTWLTGHWWIAALVLGLFIAWRARGIIAARVQDHQTGRHAGTNSGD